MLRHVLCGLVLLTWCVSQADSAAAAEKRVALVIGNSAYRHAPELTNPRNDAGDMAATFRRLGFKVLEGFDLDKVGMDRTVRDFATALAGADVGVFFYAGHGLQVAGTNYLVPVDAQLTTASALDFEMVRLDVVQRAMERGAPANVLFLDACRDNPLTRNLARAMGTRSADIGRGLAAAESGVGTLISFSTQPGNVALDGTGRNSPFTAALLKAISTPGEDISNMLIGVRNEVMAATRDRQVPWEHSALRARFYFAQPQAAPPSAQAASPAPASKREETQPKAREPSSAVASAVPLPTAPALSDCPDDFRSLVGSTEHLACTCSPEAARRGIVWGMDVYAPASSICQAALHAGAIGKSGGPVTVVPEAGRNSYPGVTRRGVGSMNAGAAEGSFRFVHAPPSSDCPDDFRTLVGSTEQLACTCSQEATRRGIVWGMDVYAPASSICQAALHAGVIGKAGGPVTVVPEAGRNRYPGVTRRDVGSMNASGAEGSFRFVGAPDSSDCPDDFRSLIGSTEHLACTCSPDAARRGIVWGADVYAPASSICQAALHAGVINKNGGPVTVVPEPGRNSYPGATQRGVRSMNTGAADGSFRFAAPK